MGFVQCNFRNVAIVAVDRERLCQPFFLNCIARSHKNSPYKLWKKEVVAIWIVNKSLGFQGFSCFLPVDCF
jgi:hypothetical protein